MKSILDINIQNKKVLIRVDYNVPVENGIVKNNFRIIQSLKTINYCLAQGSSVVIMSHMGRPNNNSRDESLSLKPVANELSKLLNKDIKFSDCCINESSINISKELKPNEIHLLENLRFHSGEKNNDDDFSSQLSNHGDVYVNDAFGTAHRAHASNVGIVQFMNQSVIGFLNMKEFEYLSRKLSNPIKPYSFILGGLKVADKIKLINNIMKSANTICIGGAMAFTLLKAKGVNIGNSYFEESALSLAQSIIDNAEKSGIELILPIDAVVSDDINNVQNANVRDMESFDAKDSGFDIGPKTTLLFMEKIKKSKTIVWNGPLGVAENPVFANGTNKLAKFLNDLKGTSTIIGGGDTASCIYSILPENNFSHISTGGGSSLELLSGNKLPAFEVLL